MSKYWYGVREDQRLARQERIFWEVLTGIVACIMAAALLVKWSGRWPVFGLGVVVFAGFGLVGVWLRYGGWIMSRLTSSSSSH